MSDDNAHSEPPASDPKLVLIAEDEELIADALASIIADAGYTPAVARHGRAALGVARARHPALVITDLMMPYMGGADLIAALHTDAANDGHAPPPIILLTAAGSRRVQTAGADAVLHKPFNIADLEALLRRFLWPPAVRDEQEADGTRVHAPGAQGESGD